MKVVGLLLRLLRLHGGNRSSVPLQLSRRSAHAISDIGVPYLSVLHTGGVVSSAIVSLGQCRIGVRGLCGFSDDMQKDELARETETVHL